MSTPRLLIPTALAILSMACAPRGACEYWSEGGAGISEQYYCWNGEEQEFCESAAVVNSAYHPGTQCDALGYGSQCTSDELGEAALQDQWTSADSCDTSMPPVGRTAGEGSGGGETALASCTDSTGVCSQLNSGSVADYQGECELGGGVFATSACPSGAYTCTGGTGSSGSSTVQLDIHWPAGICDRAEFADIVYLQGTCVNVLGGSYSGDADSCCSGTTSPAPGGTTCQ